MNREKAVQTAIFITCALGLLLLPRLVSEVKLNLAIEILFFALFATSFNILFGYTGLLPFGHAASFGIGAYAFALLLNYSSEIPVLVLILFSGLMGMLGALLIGSFCVRLKGAYFALLTLAFQQFIYAVALKWREVTNGDDGMGISRPDFYLPGIGTISMTNFSNLYYVTLFVVALAILLCYLLIRTPLGNAMISIRENEERASFLGYQTYYTKLAAFTIAGLFAGIAGGFFTFFAEFVSTDTLDLNTATEVVIMAILGGTGSFLGPALGAAFYMLFQDWVSGIDWIAGMKEHWLFFMGLIFVVMVLYVQGGIMGLVQSARIRRLVYGRRAISTEEVET